MAKKDYQKKRSKNNRKVNVKIKIGSNHASLCALVPVIKDKNVLQSIHNKVNIKQKRILLL